MDKEKNSSCQQTLMEMCRDRGIKRETDVQSLPKMENKSWNKTLERESKMGENDSGSHLHIMYLPHEESTKPIRTLKQVKSKVSSLKDGDQLVVVVDLKNLNVIQKEWLSHADERVCIFDMSHLRWNVSKHKMVPKHQKIEKREIDYISKKYNLKTLDDLPLIDVRDPVVKYFGWRCGDVCKIFRNPRLCPTSVPPTSHIGSGVSRYTSYRLITNLNTSALS